MKNEEWTKMSPQEQREQTNEELGDVVKILRAHGRQFVLAVLDEVEGGGPEATSFQTSKHEIACEVNVNDDHHYLDMICALIEVWRECNHPKA
jgi:hypothetical protein